MPATVATYCSLPAVALVPASLFFLVFQLKDRDELLSVRRAGKTRSQTNSDQNKLFVTRFSISGCVARHSLR